MVLMCNIIDGCMSGECRKCVWCSVCGLVVGVSMKCGLLVCDMICVYMLM